MKIPEESVALVHSLEESCVADEDSEVLGEGLSLQSQPHPRPRVTDLRLKVKFRDLWFSLFKYTSCEELE